MKKYKEIVINKCYGGFGLTHKAIMLYAKLSGFKLYPFVEMRKVKGKKWSELIGKYRLYKDEKSKDNPYDLIFYTKKPLKKDGTYQKNSWFSDDDIERDDPNLIKVIKQLKGDSFGHHADLKIVKIPANVDFEIEEYDGQEWIAEKHETWG